jgi:hypothetical protein
MGSGWKPVADILGRNGYTVYVVQEPETTFAADRARLHGVRRADGAEDLSRPADLSGQPRDCSSGEKTILALVRSTAGVIPL